MDSSGNNRYELLFMDDDISDPLDNVVAKNKKQVKATTTAGGGAAPSSSTNKPSGESVTTAKAGPSNKKLPHQAEKENKPSAMNKNDLNKKQTGGTLSSTPGHTADKFNSKQGGAAGAGNGNGNNGNGNVNRKRNGPGNDTREPGQGQGPRSVNFKQQNGDTRDGASQQQQQPRQFRDRDNRGPPRSRNFEGNNRGGKREFDRQSGSDKTGVKAIDKRDGAGAHNWGSVKEAIDDVNKNDSDTGVAAEKAEESGNEQVDQVAVEEETKELTLDEWKAQKQQRAKPTYNIRKAGEGEDTSQWKKMVVLNNAKKKENESEDELEFDPAMYPQRVGRQQRVLDIQFNFNDGRRGGGGGGFGGRGRGRGQRPMGGGGPFGGGGGGGGAGGPGAFNGAPGGITPNASVANISERPPGRGGFEGGRGNFASATGRGGKRTFGGERQQNTAPKVNDERQFPTLA